MMTKHLSVYAAKILKLLQEKERRRREVKEGWRWAGVVGFLDDSMRTLVEEVVGQAAVVAGVGVSHLFAPEVELGAGEPLPVYISGVEAGKVNRSTAARAGRPP